MFQAMLDAIFDAYPFNSAKLPCEHHIKVGWPDAMTRTMTVTDEPRTSRASSCFNHDSGSVLTECSRRKWDKDRKLLSVSKKINMAFNERLGYFTSNSWVFDDGNLQRVQKAAPDRVNELFPTGIKGFRNGIREYMMKSTIGMIEYISEMDKKLYLRPTWNSS